MTVNFAEVFPAGMVTVDGRVASLLLLERLTFTPPVGAAVPIVTVPLEVFPPTTDAGLRVKPVMTGGLTVSDADSETPFKLPVIVTDVCAETVRVLIANAACVLPAGIVIETGTVAALKLLESFTIIPPVGAAPERVAVPVEDVSPTTVDGFTVTEARLAGLIERLAVCETDPRVAVIVAAV